MQERIKKLRKMLNLTQAKFAERIGVKPNTISQYESGRNDPTDAVISLICREFNVNKEWLRNGEGEMLTESPKTQLDELAAKLDLDDLDKRIISGYLDLSRTDRETVKRLIQNIIDDHSALSKSLENEEELYSTTETRKKKNFDDNDDLLNENSSARLAILERENKELRKRVEAIEQEDMSEERKTPKSAFSTFYGKS